MTPVAALWRRTSGPSTWDVARARLDLLRTVGPRHVWRRFRADRRHAGELPDRRLHVAGEIWRSAAAQLGASVEEPRPGLFEFRLGAATTRIRHQTTPLNDPVAIDVASDKPLAYRLLEDAGVPVPERVVVRSRDVDGAVAFLTGIDGPCVVKPAHGGGGGGVTGGVRTVTQLRRALRRAARYDVDAVIEREVAGDAYRILLLDGVVLDVLRRRRPRVTGDGESTVEQLFFAEYERRIRAEGADGLKPFVVDLDCVFALEAGGLSLRSVLPRGVEAEVHTATNYNGPDETETYRGELGDELLAIVRRAADVLGLRFAGVDILSVDPTRSLRDTGGVVLELNPVPGLTHHYNTSDGERATPIAIPILRALLGG